MAPFPLCLACQIEAHLTLPCASYSKVALFTPRVPLVFVLRYLLCSIPAPEILFHFRQELKSIFHIDYQWFFRRPWKQVLILDLLFFIRMWDTHVAPRKCCVLYAWDIFNDWLICSQLKLWSVLNTMRKTTLKQGKGRTMARVDSGND